MGETVAAIRIERTGGPEVMTLSSITLRPPGPGEVCVRHRAIGVNFIDIYHRSGLYPLPLPTGLGLEAAGEITAVGPDVAGWSPGDRVGYFTGPVGAYAEAAVVPADRLVRLPDAMGFDEAAALLLKGATAEYLLCRTARITPGMWVLFHAGAGGVGHLALPWLKELGARVITTVGSPEKQPLVERLGADHVILYRTEPVAERVRKLTERAGAAVVYDGVGAATWRDSLQSLARRGLLVSFGNASGPVPPVRLLDLMQAGSVYLTRPNLLDYYASPEDFAEGSARLFAAWEKGVVKPRIAARLPLAEAAKAHQLLAGRTVQGSIILLP